jgi:hypothetical protein
LIIVNNFFSSISVQPVDLREATYLTLILEQKMKKSGKRKNEAAANFISNAIMISGKRQKERSRQQAEYSVGFPAISKKQ